MIFTLINEVINTELKLYLSVYPSLIHFVKTSDLYFINELVDKTYLFRDSKCLSTNTLP